MIWPTAFALTQALELPVWLWAMHVDGGPGSKRARLGVAFMASALTHPWVWLMTSRLPSIVAPVGDDASLYRAWVAVTVVAELFAWAVEGWWLGRFGLRRPWAWSFVVNGVSLAIGLLVV